MLNRVVQGIALLVLLAAGAARAAEPASLPSRGGHPDKTLSAQDQATVLVFGCFTAMVEGQLNSGINACSQAIELDPKDAEPYKLRGYLYLMDHRFDPASADFRMAQRLRPNDPQIDAGYGQSLGGQGRFADSVVQFAKAVAKAPDKAAFLNGLCWARVGQGNQLAQALRDCNQALAKAPGAATVLNTRGLAYFRMGNYRAALADYDASLAKQPHQASARFGHGLAQLKLGRKAEGAMDISDARQIDSQIDDLFVQVGVLSRQCGASMGRKGCPAGFPQQPPKDSPDHPWVAVSWTVSQEKTDLLNIEAGRLEVMVEQIAPHTPQLAAGGQTREESIIRHLSRTVTRFDNVLPAACRTYRLQESLCVAYRPAWLNQNIADGDAALDEVYHHITPVWHAVCRARRDDCQME